MKDTETLEKSKYKPVHFLRAHSKENNKSDIQTEVWACAFEPNTKKPGCFTSLLATCGGNSVCITDVETASVKFKFNGDIGENFFALAWGVSLSHSAYQLLAVGGNRNRIYFISTKDLRVDATQVIAGNQKKLVKTAINSLIFHPTQLDILMCGMLSSKNEVLITQFSHNNLSDLKIIQRLYCPSEINQLSFQPTSNMLFCGHRDGLHAWDMSSIPNQDSDCNDGFHVVLPDTPVVFNESKAIIQPDEMVDTVLALTGTTWVACKTLKSGHIIIFDTKNAKFKNSQLQLSSFQFLKWAISYDLYLSLGWEPERKIVACGDYKGTIWLYNLENLQFVSNCSNEVIQPSILTWPKKLQDPKVENERKLKIGTYEIFVSQVALNGSYLAAVTRTNLICIWKEADLGSVE